MISRTLFTDILMIVFLVALQIFVLNRITLFGKYTPVLYPVFVMFYPFFRNRFQFLALSFLLGLSIDAFLYTWGINHDAVAAALKSGQLKGTVKPDKDGAHSHLDSTPANYEKLLEPQFWNWSEPTCLKRAKQ